ncbi:hypothetical protein TIFTF001_004527 [Ficus carica]|uniref:Uncharacterized protein n=1 Tax=Ficus carica TaxID=3494 RepID=A0AA87ZI12_FICCA|nr:hypothetical protein TIFTF001_004527 [Ficus carica]
MKTTPSAPLFASAPQDGNLQCLRRQQPWAPRRQVASSDWRVLKLGLRGRLALARACMHMQNCWDTPHRIRQCPWLLTRALRRTWLDEFRVLAIWAAYVVDRTVGNASGTCVTVAQMVESTPPLTFRPVPTVVEPESVSPPISNAPWRLLADGILGVFGLQLKFGNRP